jgi:hypothetical protein
MVPVYALITVMPLLAGAPITAAGECVREGDNAALETFRTCENFGPAGLVERDWETATKQEKAKANATCAAASTRVQRMYGINIDDMAALVDGRADHRESRGIGGWLFNTEEEPGFPIAIGFRCADGKNRVILRIRSSIWLQYPERFARSAPFWGPSPPESGHGAEWFPSDLFVVTDATPQGDLLVMPPGTLGRVVN